MLLTDEAGGIVNDPVLLRLEENRFWLACADSDVLLWAKGVARNAGMDVQIRELDVAPLQIQGPKSRDLVRDLFGERVLELRYYQFFETKLGRIPVIVTRTGWTGELGYELYLLDPPQGVDLWNRVLKAGKKYKIAPTGPSDIRRIEAGILNHGIDMTLENNPYELGLERLVNLDKAAEFIGRDALQKVFTRGHPAQAGGRRDLRETDGHEHDALPGQGRRLRHVVRVLAAAEEEHRLRHAAGRKSRREKAAHRSPRRRALRRVVPMPFIDPKKAIAKS